MRQLKGSELTLEDQRYVLAAYVHRYTGDHKPRWTNEGLRIVYPLQFETDKQWLENTLFSVRINGQLDKRFKRCTSTPVWPNGK